MSTTIVEPQVHTLEHERREFLKAVDVGICCEIDEAMFIYYLETSPPLHMNCQVILPGGRLQRAQYVMKDRDHLRAFWIETEGDNPADRRYFAQNLPTHK